MHRITIEYGVPEDVDAFEAHYHDAHLPLVAALPGLRRLTLTRPRTVAAPAPVHLVAELWFDNADGLRQAVTSPEMAATAADADALAERCGVPWRSTWSGAVETVELW